MIIGIDIGKELGKGINLKVKQKGLIHFEIDIFRIVKPIIRAIIPKPVFEANPNTESNSCDKLAKHSDLSESASSENNDVAAPQPSALTSSSMTPDAISEILNRNENGILRNFYLKIGMRIDCGSFNRSGLFYVEVIRESKVVFRTHTSEKSSFPDWSYVEDQFIKNLKCDEIITIQCKGDFLNNLKELRGDEYSDGDLVLGRWIGEVIELLGKAICRLALKQVTERKISMNALPTTCYVTFSLSFLPVDVNIDISAAHDTGILFVDILEAKNLASADSNGNLSFKFKRT